MDQKKDNRYQKVSTKNQDKEKKVSLKKEKDRQVGKLSHQSEFNFANFQYFGCQTRQQGFDKQIESSSA